ncbi:MAG TPA: hypothetical protein VD995_33945 [Azospirillum sp.]|nr:hypothetical protein [Azospirillum sp.]
MRRIILATLGLATLGLGACAGFPPSAEEMAKVPVVRYGTRAPTNGDYVLLYPAGAPLPVVASVGGTLLERPAQATLEVAVKRDVFVYRNWTSFDGKTWQAGGDAVGGAFEVILPGQPDGLAPGTMSARFDLKPDPKS